MSSTGNSGAPTTSCGFNINSGASGGQRWRGWGLGALCDFLASVWGGVVAVLWVLQAVVRTALGVYLCAVVFADESLGACALALWCLVWAFEFCVCDYDALLDRFRRKRRGRRRKIGKRRRKGRTRSRMRKCGALVVFHRCAPLYFCQNRKGGGVVWKEEGPGARGNISPVTPGRSVVGKHHFLGNIELGNHAPVTSLFRSAAAGAAGVREPAMTVLPSSTAIFCSTRERRVFA